MLPVLERMRNRFGLDRAKMNRVARELGAAFDVKPNMPVAAAARRFPAAISRRR